jgi:hypothetical protein
MKSSRRCSAWLSNPWWRPVETMYCNPGRWNCEVLHENRRTGSAPSSGIAAKSRTGQATTPSAYFQRAVHRRDQAWLLQELFQAHPGVPEDLDDGPGPEGVLLGGAEIELLPGRQIHHRGIRGSQAAAGGTGLAELRNVPPLGAALVLELLSAQTAAAAASKAVCSALQDSATSTSSSRRGRTGAPHGGDGDQDVVGGREMGQLP